MLKNLLRPIVLHVKLCIHMEKWRKNNSHNTTQAKTLFPIRKVVVGKHTYGPLNVFCCGNDEEEVKIGNYCSISNGVKFLLGGEHHPEYLMNYPFKLYLLTNDDIDDRRTKGAIVVCDDVWIGTDAIILSGVTIGQGAIIAAGSVVSKDVPPYAIYTTNRIIKYRFSKDIIDKLVKIDFTRLEFEFVKEHIELFYKNDVDNILNSAELVRFMKGLKEERIECKCKRNYS